MARRSPRICQIAEAAHRHAATAAASEGTQRGEARFKQGAGLIVLLGECVKLDTTSSGKHVFNRQELPFLGRVGALLLSVPPLEAEFF